MGILLNLTAIVAAFIFATIGASPIQNIYCATVSSCNGGFFGFDLSILSWISSIYIFLVTLLLTYIHGRGWFWWLVAALSTALLFEGVTNLASFYVPVLIGLLGYGFGRLFSQLVHGRKADQP